MIVRRLESGETEVILARFELRTLLAKLDGHYPDGQRRPHSLIRRDPPTIVTAMEDEPFVELHRQVQGDRGDPTPSYLSLKGQEVLAQGIYSQAWPNGEGQAEPLRADDVLNEIEAIRNGG